MKVTEVARLLGTTADTIRYYTRLNVLNPIKSINGYKCYSDKDLGRMRFILSARKLGFTVADVKEILSESDHGKTACPTVRKIIKARLEETEKQFQAMLKLRNNMVSAIERWENMADSEPNANEVCHLIQHFEYKDDGGTANDV